MLPVSSLRKFRNYPFSVPDNHEMAELVLSIRKNGVLTPVTVMRMGEDRYEIISGHRRKRACELAGTEYIPAVIKDVTRDEATIMMADCNLQREEILPSEKAKAYEMKLEAMKNARKDGLLNITEKNERTIDILASESEQSAGMIKRYIRLNHLIPPLSDLVDRRRIGITTAAELSYLKPQEQELLMVSIDTEGVPTRSQALSLKKLSEEGKITEDSVFEIMKEQKKQEQFNIVIPYGRLEKYFPKNATPLEIGEKLVMICERLYSRQMKMKKENTR